MKNKLIKLRLLALLVSLILLISCSAQVKTEFDGNKTLRVALPKITTLDPIYADETNEIFITSFLYRTLTNLKNGYAVSGLAEYELGEDSKSVKFTLKDDALFNDGTKITSKDVKASISRIANPLLQSPAVSLISDIKGYAEAKAGNDFSGIKIINNKVFEINLIRSRSDFPTIFANPYFGIISKKSINKEGRLLAPTISSGNFQVDSKSLNSDGTLKSVVDFLGTKNREVDKVKITFVATEAEGVKLFEQKKVDISSLPQSAKLPKGASNKGIANSVRTVFYAFNVRNDLLKNADLRAAIISAIDRKTIIKKVYENDATLANSIIPSNVFGFDYICPNKCEFSVDKAKELLKKSGVDANAIIIPIDIDDSPTQKMVADAIANDLRNIGIKTEIRVTKFEDLLGKIANFETGIFRFGWISDGASSALAFERLFNSQSQENVSGFVDDATNEHIEVALSSDQKKLIENQLKFVQQNVAKGAVIIPLANLTIRFAVSNNIDNFSLDINGKLNVDQVSFKLD